MKFSEFPYQRPDFQKIMEETERHTVAFRSADSVEKQFSIFKKMETVLKDVATQSSICHIRNSVDTRDSFYDAERAYFDEMEPLFEEKLQAFHRAVLETKFRTEWEAKFGTLFFENIEIELKSFSPEIIPLIQEANGLENQYQKLYASAKIPFDGKTLTIAQLTPYKQSPDREVRKAALEAEGQFFDEHQKEFNEIYDKLVKNRTEQARRLGYQNFVELGYLRRNRNCYQPADVERFRKQVREDLVPVTVELKKNQAQRIGVTDFKFWDNAFTFPDGNAVPKGTPEELLGAGKRMYTEMSPETADFIKMMFDMDLFDVLSKEGKAPGGYCTSLPDYHCPFIFSNFNGTSGDVDVLTHEAGHAFAFYTADKEIDIMELQQPTMESCEIHSMSMEFLTAPWHHLFFHDQTAKYEYSHGEDALFFIPYGCMMDHFQEIVYSHPDMTPEERNHAWMELEKAYRPYLDFESLPFYSRGAGWQRQLHVYLYPFYYIDYCLAQSIALQFWMAAVKDRDDAWKKYLAFVRLGGTKTFTELVKAVGFRSPFEDGAVKSIAEQVGAWLKEHQV